MDWRDLGVDIIDNHYICDSVIWAMRDKIEPPYTGYTMFASSDPDTNIEYLLDVGYRIGDISVVKISDHYTVWIKED